MKKKYDNKRPCYSNNVKKHQRILNNFIKNLNKAVAEDNVWQGRFVVKQIYREFISFEDKSGSELYAYLVLIDKKTGKIKRVPPKTVNEFCYYFKLWDILNNFIVLDCDANIHQCLKENINYNNYKISIYTPTPTRWEDNFTVLISQK